MRLLGRVAAVRVAAVVRTGGPARVRGVGSGRRVRSVDDRPLEDPHDLVVSAELRAGEPATVIAGGVPDDDGTASIVQITCAVTVVLPLIRRRLTDRSAGHPCHWCVRYRSGFERWRGWFRGAMVGKIQFDEDAAERLITAATSADIQLLAAGAGRRAAAEAASEEFSGAYADRFAEAAAAEASDRIRLAGALGRLADSVAVVIGEARRERERLEALAAWQTRQTQRCADDYPGNLVALGIVSVPVFDPQPDRTPIRPTPVSAAFSASDRPRVAGGSSAGKSSADPERLRSFASSTRASNQAFSEGASRLRAAWSGFTSACGWAEISRATLVVGFDRFIAENAEDAAWIERVADAFELAGGGHVLSNLVLDAAAAADIPAAIRKLFEPGVSPADAAEIWSGLGFRASAQAEVTALPLDVLAMLGELEGIPYWARDVANQEVLRERLTRKNLAPVERAALEDIESTLGGDRQLIELTADVPPLAAVSIGNLDHADNVTWAVPGMGSSTEHMSGWVQAAQNVADEQLAVAGAGKRAVIAWMGYEAPPLPPDLGVFNAKAAERGAPKLAASIRGLAAARSGDAIRTNVLAHSYGTTTASLGLTETGVHVNTFTSAASAGVPKGIPTAADIHADHVYAGQAQDSLVGIPGFGDQYAYIGRDFSIPNRIDPTSPSFGATTFGANGVGALRGVKDHGVHADGNRGYFDPGTESLRNIALTTTGHGDRVTP